LVLDEPGEIRTPTGRLITFNRYGRLGGHRVFYHYGISGTRHLRPRILEAVERHDVELLVLDRPGYGTSTRLPNRKIADVVLDVSLVADSAGWKRFAVYGTSGGGPYALACAALLHERIDRCAAVSTCMVETSAHVQYARAIQTELRDRYTGIRRHFCMQVALQPRDRHSPTGSDLNCRRESPASTQPVEGVRMQVEATCSFRHGDQVLLEIVYRPIRSHCLAPSSPRTDDVAPSVPPRRCTPPATHRRRSCIPYRRSTTSSTLLPQMRLIRHRLSPSRPFERSSNPCVRPEARRTWSRIASI